MKNLCAFVIVFGVLKAAPILAIERDLLSQPAVLKLYEVDGKNNVLGPYDRIDMDRSEVIVEKVGHLRLECHAHYPVQWIYIGNGIPILSSNLTLSTTQKSSESLNWRYIASAFLSPLRKHHTGEYQCSRTDYPTTTPYIYIYVPGQNLFTSQRGKTITISENDSTLLIPCSVSDPRAEVSLEKSDGVSGKVFKKFVTKSKDAIIYDPRIGFRVNLNKIEDVEGTYACTSRYNNVVRAVEYTVISNLYRPTERPPQNLQGNFACSPRSARATTSEIAENQPSETEFRQRSTETCIGASCGNRCESHTDCPAMMNCYTDRTCRDPCVYSIRCGKAALCRVKDYRPECYCPRDFFGDATKECFNP